MLFAYHLEALVPTTTSNAHASQIPEKINAKDVQFFSIGVLQGRTLVIYMKKKGVRSNFVETFNIMAEIFMYLKNGDCVLHAVEPIIDKINELPKPPGGRLLSLKRNKTEWFRLYKEFTFPDAHDVIFLKTRIAVLGTKGFNIMDLTE